MKKEKNKSLDNGKAGSKQIWVWVLLIFFVLIFIGAVVIFFGGWWVYKSKVHYGLNMAEDQKDLFEDDNWLDNLDSYFMPNEDLEDIAAIFDEPNIINGTEKFASNEYGFTLNFNDNWLDYKIKLEITDNQIELDLEGNENLTNEEIEQMRQGARAKYIFYYPSMREDLSSDIDGYKNLFALNIFDINDYIAIVNGKVQEIARNNKYIFTYSKYFSHNEVLPPGIPQSAIDDIDAIMNEIEVFDVKIME